ncbi:MAG: Rieske 2Fe-2S domain-containing protein [Gammaproteobacteria bacterium]|nr:Rieske 2Fe-2S domain-containing protein [Gammaproteobacteria bacterium]MBV9697274.1 Rieske 2Fe-2S domain-containing protein [Gammaproteobacteria bacterium]
MPETAGTIDLERVICRLEDLDVEGTRGFTLGGGTWPLRGFLVRDGAAVHAYVNRCPHAGSPLNLLPHRFLSADGRLILCTAHGALFEKGTGRCVAGPCFGAALQRLAVEVRAGYVLVAPEVELRGAADD